MVLEKTLASPLECKEIQPVHSDPQGEAGLTRKFERSHVGVRADLWVGYMDGKEVSSPSVQGVDVGFPGCRGDGRGMTQAQRKQEWDRPETGIM